jgi:hypothetical protein
MEVMAEATEATEEATEEAMEEGMEEGLEVTEVAKAVVDGDDK